MICTRGYEMGGRKQVAQFLCNFWSDGRINSFVAFSVACPKGTMFLRSIDISGHVDDPHYIFGLLEPVVPEVGVESVVQVLTDSAECYSYAGKLLMDKYPSIFWSPCPSHCIGEILEDISKLEWVSTILEEASIVTKYIYSNECDLNIMQKFTGGMELIRPKISRYVAEFLSLRCLVLQEENLKHMFSQTEWLGSSATRRPDTQLIKTVLYIEQFWNSAHEFVCLSEPLLKILRILKGDMPAISYLYERMERIKNNIKESYGGIVERYIPIWDIIERRWNMQLHSLLHAAAVAFLNPSIFYGHSSKVDSRMRNGFQESMMKMATEDTDRTEITKEHPDYINAHDALGTEFAIKGRTLNTPGDWWATYGYETPRLQKYAIRILSQPSSSQWCRWKWRNFESLHRMRLTRAELDKLSDLVFVRSNLWLQEIVRNRDRQYKPIIFDEIDVGSEWPSESEISCPLLDDCLLENDAKSEYEFLH